MDILSTLKQLKNTTPNEAVLIEYILKHPEQCLNLKPKEIAKAAYVSLATLYRLLEKIECAGVNEFKIELAIAISGEKTAPEQGIDVNYPISSQDNFYQIMEGLDKTYQQTLEDTRSKVNALVLRNVIDLLADAPVIDLYTTSSNVYFAQNFAFQMQEIGRIVNVPTEEYISNVTAANSDENHVALMISYGGRRQGSKALIELLQGNQTPIILITSTQGNPLEAHATLTLYMSSDEDHYDKISSFSSRLSLLYLLDLLYANIVSTNFNDYIHYKKSHYQRIAKALG